MVENTLYDMLNNQFENALHIWIKICSCSPGLAVFSVASIRLLFSYAATAKGI